MANVESSNWLMTATQKENMQLIEKKREAMRAAGKRILEPGQIIKTSLRGLSVFRILIASMMPGVRSKFNIKYSSLNLGIEYHSLLGHFGNIWPTSNVGDGLDRLST